VRVPAEAIVRRDGRTLVWLVSNGKAQPRVIDLTTHDGLPIATHGLSVGDTVVLRPPPELQEGDPVRLSAAGARSTKQHETP
jgi:hypothetical protein